MAGVVTSPEHICNMALGHIKRPGNISSLSDRSTKAARVCERFYENTRDGMLQGYQWNFSMKWVSLAADPTPPSTTAYSLAVVLPGDRLRVIEVDGLDKQEWEVEEGSRLLVNASAPVKVRYVRRITDPTRYPALFVSMLSLQLAQDIAPEMSRQDMMSELERKFAKFEAQAKRFDALEKSERPRPNVSRYISARRSGRCPY